MSLKNKIERELGIPIRVRAGAPGSFSVLIDGQRIYSKDKQDDAPDSAQIMQLIREKTAPGR